MTRFGDNRCPVCRTALWAPDSDTISTKKCPRCGAELWVLVGSKGPVFFARPPGQTKRQFLAALGAAIYGTTPEEMETQLKDADSLDIVEFVMELEDAAGSA
ncbi:MAG: hypothetical protein L0215_14130 [Gemmataceae bacterium]|nr:hypothetical protein [Gemmataceae bacterium]